MSIWLRLFGGFLFVFLPTLTERAFSYPSVRKKEKTEDLSYALKVFSLGSVSQPLCQLINKSINTSVRNHTIDRLEERGVDRASARRSSLKGRERAIKDERGPSSIRRTVEPLQRRHWGNFPERQSGAHMGFSERIDTILNWTEENWVASVPYWQSFSLLHLCCIN